MNKPFKTDNPELEALFERYRGAPDSYVFAPLADGCRKAGMLEEAIEICEKGVSAHPGYASGYVVRGKCYYDLGNADQAEASFEKVLELDGNNLVALKYVGLILAERGQAREARARFELILALDPDDKEIAEKLATLGDPDASMDVSLARELNEVLGEERVVDDAGDSDGDDTDDWSDTADPVELRDVEDDTFVGAEITLGDGGATPDVLATMTLADIYASQGYRKKAIKIYSELLEARPGHHAITAKLRELGVVTTAGPGDGTDESEVPVEPVEVAHEGAEDTVAATGESDADAGTEAAPALESAAVGVDPDDPHATPRSAAHFKRWLDNFSR